MDMIGIRERAKQERPVPAERIVGWWKASVLGERGRNVKVPPILGPMRRVEEVLDEMKLPFYIVESSSRSASIAPTYTVLQMHEEAR